VSIFDLIILILLALFTGIGALRGMLRETLSLAVWTLAIVCGWLFADAVSTWFDMLEDVNLRHVLAFALIVPVMLVVLSIMAFVLRRLLPRPVPGLTDRGIGALMGAIRGAVVVIVMVLLAGLTSLPKKADWSDSYFVGIFQPAASKILEWLPTLVARQFSYG